MSAWRSNAFTGESSLCWSGAGSEAALADEARFVAMAIFGSKSDAASRAVDGASGRGNPEADDRPEVEATASLEICSGERRPFPSVVIEEDSAIRSCELSATESREGGARRALKVAISGLPASS